MNEEIFESRTIPDEEREKIEDRVIDMDPDKLKFYEDLRRKAKDWSSQKGGKAGSALGEYLFLLPDFFVLLTRLMLDKRVPGKIKLMVSGIIAYIMLPLDIIPDFIPVIGYMDDLVLAVMGLNMVLNEIDPNIVAENWSGKGPILEHLKKISATAERFLDKNVLKHIKKWLGKRS